MPESFSKEQEAFIEKVAWDVGDRIAARVEQSIDTKIASHAGGCPTTKRLTRMFWICVGVGIGTGMGSVGLIQLIGKIAQAASP